MLADGIRAKQDGSFYMLGLWEHIDYTQIIDMIALELF